MPPQVTIAIPVYNAEKYIRQCLESCVNQTLTDIEIICVDHESPDGSRAILEEFAARDARVRIIDCPNTGGGPGQARNAAFAHVQSKYLYFVDDDDRIDPTLCEKAYRYLEATGYDMVLLDYFQTIGGEIVQDYCSTCHRFPDSSSDSTEYLGYEVMPWLRVIRTEFIESRGLRYLEGLLPDDIYFHWLMIVSNAKIGLLREKLYYYSQHPSSVMADAGEYLARTPEVFAHLRDYLEANGKFEQFRILWLQAKVVNSLWSYCKVRKDVRPLARKAILDSTRDDEWDWIDEMTPQQRYRLLRLLKNGKSDSFFFFMRDFNAFFVSPITRPVRYLRNRVLSWFCSGRG